MKSPWLTAAMIGAAVLVASATVVGGVAFVASSPGLNEMTVHKTVDQVNAIPVWFVETDAVVQPWKPQDGDYSPPAP